MVRPIRSLGSTVFRTGVAMILEIADEYDREIERAVSEPDSLQL
jgi:hypothetical protein